ncbi:response regulator [Massilia sp. B-10]|nr:response regulator [Massilia sp. B-10]
MTAETYRILLADDNVDFVNSIGALLSAMGHSVVITHNGPDALTAAARFCPDYAFLDIGLPQMSGYDLARGIRRLSCGPMTMLIAVTGWGRRRTASWRSRPGSTITWSSRCALSRSKKFSATAPWSRKRVPERAAASGDSNEKGLKIALQAFRLTNFGAAGRN